VTCFQSEQIPASTEGASRSLLARMNATHLRERGESDLLEARIRSYQLADRMQRVVPQVTNLESEPKSIHALYGTEQESTRDFGRSCLLARRLLEHGVRFIQLFSGGAFGSPRINWDGHENMLQNHGREARRIDQPLAGLLRDLRQRGMLDDTLVMFTSEFGRTPFTQSAANVVGAGRDHNEKGFTVWMAGGGLKPGIAYGSTDDVGWQAVEDRVHWHDLHATVLHQLGINHERLTYYHNGIARRLTNVHGNLVRGIIS
jgi:membrane-anchored protein YejM (alkaline phosphatase superfamily)